MHCGIPYEIPIRTLRVHYTRRGIGKWRDRDCLSHTEKGQAMNVCACYFYNWEKSLGLLSLWCDFVDDEFIVTYTVHGETMKCAHDRLSVRAYSRDWARAAVVWFCDESNEKTRVHTLFFYSHWAYFSSRLVPFYFRKSGIAHTPTTIPILWACALCFFFGVFIGYPQYIIIFKSSTWRNAVVSQVDRRKLILQLASIQEQSVSSVSLDSVWFHSLQWIPFIAMDPIYTIILVISDYKRISRAIAGISHNSKWIHIIIYSVKGNATVRRISINHRKDQWPLWIVYDVCCLWIFQFQRKIPVTEYFLFCVLCWQQQCAGLRLFAFYV